MSYTPPVYSNVLFYAKSYTPPVSSNVVFNTADNNSGTPGVFGEILFDPFRSVSFVDQKSPLDFRMKHDSSRDAFFSDNRGCMFTTSSTITIRGIGYCLRRISSDPNKNDSRLVMYALWNADTKELIRREIAYVPYPHDGFLFSAFDPIELKARTNYMITVDLLGGNFVYVYGLPLSKYQLEYPLSGTTITVGKMWYKGESNKDTFIPTYPDKEGPETYAILPFGLLIDEIRTNKETVQDTIHSRSTLIERIKIIPKETPVTNIRSSSTILENKAYQELSIRTIMKMGTYVSDKMNWKEGVTSTIYVSSFLMERHMIPEREIIQDSILTRSSCAERFIVPFRELLIVPIHSLSSVLHLTALREKIKPTYIRSSSTVECKFKCTVDVLIRSNSILEEQLYIPSGIEVHYTLKIADEINFRLGVSDSVTYNRMKTGDAFSFTLKIGGE